MIKIYTEEQSPLGIFVALDETARPRGPPSHPGHHGHPHGPHGPHHHGPPPFGPFGHSFGGCRPNFSDIPQRPWGRGGPGRWGGGGCGKGRKLERFADELLGAWRKPNGEINIPEELKKAARDWGADAKVSDRTPYASFTVGQDTKQQKGSEEADLEAADTQLLDEAMRLSLQEQEVAEAGRLPEAKAVPQEATAPALSESKYPPQSSYFSKSAAFSPHASFMGPSAPKPMARFVQDVTLPDGRYACCILLALF